MTSACIFLYEDSKIDAGTEARVLHVDNTSIFPQENNKGIKQLEAIKDACNELILQIKTDMLKKLEESDTTASDVSRSARTY